MLTSKKLLEELFEADYVVKASISKNGCTVEFPERLFPKHIEEYVEVFVIEPDAGIKIIKSGQDPVFIEMPNYVFRLFIITKIIYNCLLHKYDLGAIYFSKNGEQVLGFSKFAGNIVGSTTDEDKKKEDILSQIWTQAYPEGFSDSFLLVADESGVKEGYEILQQIFEEN